MIERFSFFKGSCEGKNQSEVNDLTFSLEVRNTSSQFLYIIHWMHHKHV